MYTWELTSLLSPSFAKAPETISYCSTCMMQVPSATLLCGLCFILLYLVRVGHGRYQAWRFLSQGREIILKAASSVSDHPHSWSLRTSTHYQKCGKTCFSIPVFGWGGRMHIVTTAQHWEDMRDAHPDHLSQRRWVKEVSRTRKIVVRFDIDQR